MTFYNARIALLEARMSSELSNLIRRAGGNNPICVPAVQETPLNSVPQVSAFIDRLTDGSIPIVVFFSGANLVELCLYEWALPEDTDTIKNLIKDIIAGCIDAVVFTSQIQARHLFLMATELHLSTQLAETLNTRTVVASIGPTCTGALQSYGVTPHVIPEHPKMGHLVKALAQYMA